MDYIVMGIVFLVYVFTGFYYYRKINNKLGFNTKYTNGKVFLISLLTTFLSNIILGLGLLIFIKFLGPIFTDIQNMINPYDSTFANVTFFFVMPITLLILWYYSYSKLFTLFQIKIIKIDKDKAKKISGLIVGKVLIFGILIGIILEIIVKNLN